jgi:hypothetical protein
MKEESLQCFGDSRCQETEMGHQTCLNALGDAYETSRRRGYQVRNDELCDSRNRNKGPEEG